MRRGKEIRGDEREVEVRRGEGREEEIMRREEREVEERRGSRGGEEREYEGTARPIPCIRKSLSCPYGVGRSSTDTWQLSSALSRGRGREHEAQRHSDVRF